MLFRFLSRSARCLRTLSGFRPHHGILRLFWWSHAQHSHWGGGLGLLRHLTFGRTVSSPSLADSHHQWFRPAGNTSHHSHRGTVERVLSDESVGHFPRLLLCGFGVSYHLCRAEGGIGALIAMTGGRCQTFDKSSLYSSTSPHLRLPVIVTLFCYISHINVLVALPRAFAIC